MKSIYKCKLSEMKRSLRFRALNLTDEIWIQETFADYDERMTTENIDMGIVTEILYRALENRELFPAREIKELDTDGKLATREVGGLELFRNNIVDSSDTGLVLEAFIRVLKKSRPEVVKSEKKKMMKRILIFIAFLTVFALGILGVMTRL